ncbi:hypothetical protein MPSEU_000981700 [Mayamaea pseudoterrestris]|nr:hypothetical protein MPSEU_000981700 [Mayamaea pseudoterrestris]
MKPYQVVLSILLALWLWHIFIRISFASDPFRDGSLVKEKLPVDFVVRVVNKEDGAPDAVQAASTLRYNKISPFNKNKTSTPVPFIRRRLKTPVNKYRQLQSEWRIPVMFLSLSVTIVCFGCCLFGWTRLCRLRKRLFRSKEHPDGDDGCDHQSVASGSMSPYDPPTSHARDEDGAIAYQEYKDEQRDEKVWCQPPLSPTQPAAQATSAAILNSGHERPINPWIQDIKALPMSGTSSKLSGRAKSSHGHSSSVSSSLSSASPEQQHGLAYISGLSRLSTLTNSILDESGGESSDTHGISSVLEEEEESEVDDSDGTSSRSEQPDERRLAEKNSNHNLTLTGAESRQLQMLAQPVDDRTVALVKSVIQPSLAYDSPSLGGQESFEAIYQLEQLARDDAGVLCGMQTSLLAAMMSSPFPSVDHRESDDDESDGDSGLNVSSSDDGSDLTESDGAGDDGDAMAWSDSNMSEASEIDEDNDYDEENAETTRTPRLLGEDIPLQDGEQTIEEVNTSVTSSFGFFTLSSDSIVNHCTSEEIELELDLDDTAVPSDVTEPSRSLEEILLDLGKAGYVREIHFPIPALLQGSSADDMLVSLGLQFLDAVGPMDYPVVQFVASNSPLVGQLNPGDSILSLNDVKTYGYTSQELLKSIVARNTTMGGMSPTMESGDEGGSLPRSQSQIKLTLMEGNVITTSLPDIY